MKTKEQLKKSVGRYKATIDAIKAEAAKEQEKAKTPVSGDNGGS